MAATIDIQEFNGVSPGTPTSKTSGTIRFKAADDANVDLNNPIVRPGSGSTFSYEKALRLFMTTAPTGSITNPRAFSDGANGFGTGVTMEAGVTGTYAQPVITDSTRATVDLFSYTSGSPLAMDANNPGPYLPALVGNNFADFLYLQAEVASTASPGLTPSETLTIAYDET